MLKNSNKINQDGGKDDSKEQWENVRERLARREKGAGIVINNIRSQAVFRDRQDFVSYFIKTFTFSLILSSLMNEE